MFETGNLIEGILWICIAVGFIVSLVRRERRGAKVVAAANFTLFGLSDFVEMRTGAWWRPWWLLAWKAACVAVMIVQLVSYLKRRGGSKSPAAK